jgi:hypothetical protein
LYLTSSHLSELDSYRIQQVLIWMS